MLVSANLQLRNAAAKEKFADGKKVLGQSDGCNVVKEEWLAQEGRSKSLEETMYYCRRTRVA
jgi:hypothetical protein